MSADGPPIFIVGNPRSGTTLMRTMLSAHPNIYITHETWFYIWQALADDGVPASKLLDCYFDTFSYRWLRLPTAEVMAAVPRDLTRENVHLAFRAIMRRKAEKLGRTRYGDKSPGHTSHLAAIFRDFPDARVIQMVRDPRTSVDSLRSMPWGCPRDLGNCLVYEHARKEVMPFANRVLRVRLEDLRSRPEPQMRRILAYVGEPWDDAVLSHSANSPDPRDMPPLPWFQSASHPVSGGEHRLSGIAAERIGLIETVCKDSLREFGYESVKVPNRPGKLSTMMRIKSETRDTVHYAREMEKIFSSIRNPDRWRDIADVWLETLAPINPGWREDFDTIASGAPPPRM